MQHNQHSERLSALLDGETSELELRQLLRDLSDEDLARFSRYQRTSDVVRGVHRGHEMTVPAGFHTRLSAAIEQESQQAGLGWLATLGRSAVAASVALAMVVGWQYLSSPGSQIGSMQTTVAMQVDGSADTGSAALTRPFAEAALVSSTPRSRPASPEYLDQVRANLAQQIRQERMEAMLVRHSEYAASHGSQSMMPYARLVSMDARAEP